MTSEFSKLLVEGSGDEGFFAVEDRRIV